MACLNVLTNPGRSDADYLRLFDRALLHWLKHLADEADVEVGVAFASRELPHVAEANVCLDLNLPDGISPDAALAQVEAYYQRTGVVCTRFFFHPDIADPALATLTPLLLARSYQPHLQSAYVLQQANATPQLELDGFTLIPARASYRHAIEFAQAQVPAEPANEVDEATRRHLDDPHYDAMIAIDAQGVAAASSGMLAIGDVGLLRGFHVAPAHQGGELPRVMLCRALEIAARSLFRHVLATDEGDPRRASLLASAGFRPVGQLHSFARVR